MSRLGCCENIANTSFLSEIIQELFVDDNFFFGVKHLQ